MDQPDWYHGIEKVHQQRAYALAWLLCRDHATAVEQIIPTAVDIACKSVRRTARRVRWSVRCTARRARTSENGWKLNLRDPQLLQLGGCTIICVTGYL